MDLIEGFVSDCQAKGLTPHSIETYRSQIKRFLAAYSDPRTITFEDLKVFLKSLRSRNLAGSTLRGYFAALSSLYDYMMFEGLHTVNPILSFRKRYLHIKYQEGGENTRQLPDIEDVRLLISRTRNVRELAIILMFAKTGMRLGELWTLKLNNVDMKLRVIRIGPMAKRSNRLAFMDDELFEVMEQYLAWRQTVARTDWLWVTSRGGHIRDDDPGKWIKELAISLELHDSSGPLCKRFTPHCFRHFFTTNLYRAGMKEQYVKWLRGDSMTKDAWQGYNHIDPEKVRTEYLVCIPKLLSTQTGPDLQTTLQEFL